MTEHSDPWTTTDENDPNEDAVDYEEQDRARQRERKDWTAADYLGQAVQDTGIVLGSRYLADIVLNLRAMGVEFMLPDPRIGRCTYCDDCGMCQTDHEDGEVITHRGSCKFGDGEPEWTPCLVHEECDGEPCTYRD